MVIRRLLQKNGRDVFKGAWSTSCTSHPAVLQSNALQQDMFPSNHDTMQSHRNVNCSLMITNGIKLDFSKAL